jgi:hypothetical protein
MRLIKIDALTGRAVDVDTGDNDAFEWMSGKLNSYVELVRFPVVFPDRSQLIGLLNEIGAIDSKIPMNSLATQFYRVNGQLPIVKHSDGTEQPLLLWGDVYFARCDFNSPEGDLKALSEKYTPFKFLQLIAELGTAQQRFVIAD